MSCHAEIMGQKPNFKKAKQQALALLERFNYSKPAVNPLEIAGELGVQVYFVNFENEYNSIAGFFDAKDNTIFVNKTQYAPRQTFTIAHELGHKLLHEEWAKSTHYKVLLRDQLAVSNDPIEQEANAFAANLLVPKFMLDQYKSIASVSELAKLFIVSEAVIRNRLKFEYDI